jgi:hypothetical protein
MKIDNKTKLHDNTIKRIADFVMPGLVRLALDKCKTKLTIRLRPDEVTTGNNVGEGHNQWMISVMVGRKGFTYPRMEEIDMSYEGRFHRATNAGTCDYIPSFFQNLEEHIVHVIAHEMFHIAQYLAWKVEHQGERNFGEEIWNDREADRYAIAKQREWRRLHNQPIYLVPEVMA